MSEQKVWGYQFGVLYEPPDTDFLFSSLDDCYKWFTSQAAEEGLEVVSFQYFTDVINDKGCYQVLDDDKNIELIIWQRKIF